MHGIVRRAYSAMIDGMYTLTTDDLTCNNNYKHNTSYVVLSVQATVRLHEQVNVLETCTDMS